MAWFRMIDSKTWADARFRALTPPRPCGQFLWLYLLAGPHTTALPGLSRTGEGALADALAWPVRGLRAAFGEIEAQGMARADWRAPVLWLPNAIKYQFPASPNVVRSWGRQLQTIPECALKDEALARYAAALAQREAFAKAFAEVLRDPSSKPSWKPHGKAKANQEQEQEQEQEQYPPNPPAGGPTTNGIHHEKARRETAKQREMREYIERKERREACRKTNTPPGPIGTSPVSPCGG